MLHMYRIILILSVLFNSNVLLAASYDDDVLNIFSKILPRLVLMSTQEKDTNDIGICILNDEVDTKSALLLRSKIDFHYKNGIKNSKITFTTSNYSHVDKCVHNQIIFLFNTTDNNIQKVVDFSRKTKILTMAYDSKLLNDGIDISLFLGRKIIPFINKKSIYSKDIELNNMLLRISKIYSAEEY